MTIKNESERAAPVLGQLNSAIRENPLAAGLIGAGIAWMLFGGKGLGGVTAAVSAAGRATGSAASTAGAAVVGGMVDAGSSVASGLKKAGSQMADAIPSIVPELPEGKDAMGHATAAVTDGIEAAATAGKQYGRALQSRLADGLDRQPLLLGAIGLAIGAGIASTFSATTVEKELMGEQAAAVRDTLDNLTGEVKDRAQQVLAGVKDEAKRQGLTPDAAKSAAADMGAKLKTVVGAGRESVVQGFPGNQRAT